MKKQLLGLLLCMYLLIIIDGSLKGKINKDGNNIIQKEKKLNYAKQTNIDVIIKKFDEEINNKINNKKNRKVLDVGGKAYTIFNVINEKGQTGALDSIMGFELYPTSYMVQGVDLNILTYFTRKIVLELELGLRRVNLMKMVTYQEDMIDKIDRPVLIDEWDRFDASKNNKVIMELPQINKIKINDIGIADEIEGGKNIRVNFSPYILKNRLQGIKLIKRINLHEVTKKLIKKEWKKGLMDKLQIELVGSRIGCNYNGDEDVRSDEFFSSYLVGGNIFADIINKKKIRLWMGYSLVHMFHDYGMFKGGNDFPAKGALYIKIESNSEKGECPVILCSADSKKDGFTEQSWVKIWGDDPTVPLKVYNINVRDDTYLDNPDDSILVKWAVRKSSDKSSVELKTLADINSAEFVGRQPDETAIGANDFCSAYFTYKIPLSGKGFDTSKIKKIEINLNLMFNYKILVSLDNKIWTTVAERNDIEVDKDTILMDAPINERLELPVDEWNTIYHKILSGFKYGGKIYGINFAGEFNRVKKYQLVGDSLKEATARYLSFNGVGKDIINNFNVIVKKNSYNFFYWLSLADFKWEGFDISPDYDTSFSSIRITKLQNNGIRDVDIKYQGLYNFNTVEDNDNNKSYIYDIDKSLPDNEEEIVTMFDKERFYSGVDIDYDYLNLKEDENNNGIDDKYENDIDPDYPYKIGTIGNKFKIGMNFSRSDLKELRPVSFYCGLDKIEKRYINYKSNYAAKFYFQVNYNGELPHKMGKCFGRIELKRVKDSIFNHNWGQRTYYAEIIQNQYQYTRVVDYHDNYIINLDRLNMFNNEVKDIKIGIKYTKLKNFIIAGVFNLVYNKHYFDKDYCYTNYVQLMEGEKDPYSKDYTVRDINLVGDVSYIFNLKVIKILSFFKNFSIIPRVMYSYFTSNGDTVNVINNCTTGVRDMMLYVIYNASKNSTVSMEYMNEKYSTTKSIIEDNDLNYVRESVIGNVKYQLFKNFFVVSGIRWEKVDFEKDNIDKSNYYGSFENNWNEDWEAFIFECRISYNF